MKTIYSSILFLLISTMVYSQSLNDLLYFRSMGLNEIEETLILKDWNFKSSKKDQKKEFPKKSKGFLDMYEASNSDTYESRTYEYIGYAGDITTIEITDYADSRQNKITIKSENKLVYQNILEDLVTADFRVSNESSPYESYYLGDYKIGEKVITESNGKIYRSGKNKLHLIINKYVIVESKNLYDNTFSYDPTRVIDEYQIYVE